MLFMRRFMATHLLMLRATPLLPPSRDLISRVRGAVRERRVQKRSARKEARH